MIYPKIDKLLAVFTNQCAFAPAHAREPGEFARPGEDVERKNRRQTPYKRAADARARARLDSGQGKPRAKKKKKNSIVVQTQVRHGPREKLALISSSLRAARAGRQNRQAGRRRQAASACACAQCGAKSGRNWRESAQVRAWGARARQGACAGQ